MNMTKMKSSLSAWRTVVLFLKQDIADRLFPCDRCDPTEFGKLTEEVETLAGLLLEIKGDFPRRREIIEYETIVSRFWRSITAVS